MLRTLAAALVLPASLGAQVLDSARFATPPADVRPAMLWFWNGRITDSLIDRQLADMRGVGLAEVVIFPYETDRLDPRFFSDGWFARIEHALREAQRTGMRIWLSDRGRPDTATARRAQMLHRDTIPGDSVLFARSYGAAAHADPMNDEAVRRLLDAGPGEYYRRFPWAFGSVLRGFWEEDSPEPALAGVPWSDSLPGALRALGQSPATVMPAVFDDLGRPGRILRGAFWRAVADQFTRAWSRQRGEWAMRHGVEFVSNPPPGLAPNHHGDPFKAHRWIQVPGAAVRSRQFLPGGRTLFPRYATSAAHLASQPRALAALFGGYDWRLTPEEARFVIGAMAVRGVNLIVLHAYWSDTSRVRNPPPLDPSNPWWFAMGDLVTWAGRVSDLTLGRSAARLAVLVPSRAAEAWQGTPERQRIDSTFGALVATLEDLQASFDLVPEGALDGDSVLGLQAEPGNAELRVGAQRYRVVIVPPVRTLSLETARRLAALSRRGGTVIAWRPLPVEETRGDDAGLARAWPDTGPRFQIIDSLPQLRQTLISTPWSGVREPGPPALRILTLERGEDRVFLLFNESGRRIPIAPTFRLIGQPELWNPDIGVMRLAPTRWSPRYAVTDMPIELDPFQVVGVVFRSRPRSPQGPIGPPLVERIVAQAPTGWRFHFAAGDTTQRPWEGPLRSWTALDSTYSGTGVYEATLEVPSLAAVDRVGERYWLDLGSVRDVAEVEVNGVALGRRLWPPYRYDVTSVIRPGANRVTVRVTNTLANRKGTPLPSGLLGPVAIVWVH